MPITKLETENERGVLTGVRAEVQGVLDALPFYVMLIDADHYIVLANESVRRDIGVAPERIIGGYCHKVVHGLDRPCPGCPLEEAVKTGHTSERELLDLQSGRWTRAVVYPTRYQTQKGRPLFIHFIYDITERKQAEELFGTLSHSSPIGIYIAQDGKFQYLNPRMQELMGYDERELLGKDSLSYVHPADRDLVRANAIAMLRGERSYPYEYRTINRAGEVRYVMETITSIRYQGRRAILGNYMDITERRKMEKEMVEYKELNKLKTHLLSTVSHELRTPLATIKGYSTMLVDYDRRLEREEKRGYLISIDKATDRLTELVDHLLDVSRLDAGLLKLDRTPANVSKLIERAVEETQFRAPLRKIVLNLGKRLPWANIDARRIRQVLDNIIDNAMKYSGEGTEVVVSAKRKGCELLITVTDQGIGIPAGDLEKVFDRMYRIEQRLTQDPGGMGLGLALCKGLVEAHGSRIWIESEEGKGSTCSFTLPL